MVWIITGNLGSLPTDIAQHPSTPSSHYLRPSRTYKLGRSYFEGQPGVFTRKRCYDWKMKSNKVAKEGGFEVMMGDWGEEDVLDDPSSPTNLAPYSCTLLLCKKGHKISKETGEAEGDELGPSSIVKIESGDKYRFAQYCYVEFEWIPFILCFSAANPNTKLNQTKIAKSLGLKLAYKTYLPHHTHFLPKTLVLNHSLLVAAMNGAYILSQEFLASWETAGSLPPNSEDKLEQFTTEKSILQAGLEDVSGFDFTKFWGHSDIELDWEKNRPREFDEGYKIVAKDASEGFGGSSWDWNDFEGTEKRKRLFEGVKVFSFRGAALDEAELTLVKMGGGHFFSIPCFLIQSPDEEVVEETEITTKEELLDSVRRSLEESDQDGEAEFKFVFIPPKGIEFTGKDEGSKALREVAQEFGVTRYCDAAGANVLKAVHEADLEILLNSDPPDSQMDRDEGAEQPPEAGLLAPPTNPNSGAAPSSSALSSSYKSLVGSHPEQETLLPAPRRGADKNQGGREAGGSGTNRQGNDGDLEAAEEVPAPVVEAPVRKLTRRTKTAASTPIDVDDFWGGSHVRGASKTDNPETQVEGPSQLSLEDSEVVNYLIDDSFEVPASTKPRLKRRAGLATQAPDSSSGFFDIEDDASSTRRGKRARQDSDEAVTKRGGKETQLESVLEDEEVDTSTQATSSGKKRAAGSDDGAVEARGRGKRLRSASVEPTGVATTSKEKEKVKEKEKEKAKPTSTAVRKGAGKKGAKEQEVVEKEDARILQLKPTKRRGEGAAVDQALNEEFNALKLVRPALKPMTTTKRIRVGWDDEDPDEERQRLIRADEEAQEHPNEWAGKRRDHSFFMVTFLPMARVDRKEPRADVELEERYAGRPNFKRFLPKNSLVPRVPRQQRAQPEFTIADHADFGLGPAYQSQAKPSKKKSGKKAAAVDSDDGMDSDQQTKLSFKAKPKAKPAPKGKGKGKAVSDVDEDEDEEEDIHSSNTLRDEMDVDSDGGSEAEKSKSKKTGTSKIKPKAAAAPPKAKASAAKPTKKVQAPIILGDTSDDDSDDGLTFKGFGKSTAAAGKGTKRKR